MATEHEKLYKDKNPIYYNLDRPELHPFIPTSIKTALDVGCGAGTFGEALKNVYGCEVWGIERIKKLRKLPGVRLTKL